MNTVVVDAQKFADLFIGCPFPTEDQAYHWIGVMDGTQGTRRSMSELSEQARLDAYCLAVRPQDDLLWLTDADELRTVLTGWLIHYRCANCDNPHGRISACEDCNVEHCAACWEEVGCAECGA